MKAIKYFFSFSIIVLLSFSGQSQCTLACYADINLSLDASGNATITPSDVLADYGPTCGTLVVEPSSFDCSDIGAPIVYTVTDLLTGNSCFGNIHVEYKVTTMACYANINVALGPSGVETLTGDMLLFDPPAECIPGLIISPSTVSCADIGSPVFVTVTDPTTGNSCFTTVNVEFNSTTMACFANINAQLGSSGSLTLTPDMILADPPASCLPGLIVNPASVDCSDKGSEVFVTVTDPVSGNSCFSSVFVENPRPTSCDINVPSPIYCGDSGALFTASVVGGYGPFIYEWKIKGNPHGWSITSGQGTDAITMQVGDRRIRLELTVIDVCGKKRKTTVRVDCDDASRPISIDFTSDPGTLQTRSERTDTDELNIYPNPTYDRLNIDLSDEQNSAFEQAYIVDPHNLVHKRFPKAKKLIDLNELNAGVYWIIIELTDQRQLIKKFVKL